jgi:anti-sigma B factor antagonist
LTDSTAPQLTGTSNGRRHPSSNGSVSSNGSRRFARRMFVAATEQLDNGTAVVRVSGEVDLATVPALEQALLGVERQPHGRVIVDLGCCTFLDSTGLRALVGIRERLERSNRRLALVLYTPGALRILQVTGLDERFEIYPSLGAASTAMATAMRAVGKGTQTDPAATREHSG